VEEDTGDGALQQSTSGEGEGAEGADGGGDARGRRDAEHQKVVRAGGDGRSVKGGW
jgi:hypothetical protein